MIKKPPESPNHDPSVQHAILDCVGDGVFTVGPDLRITAFNRAAQEITGVSREQAMGRPCYEIFNTEACESRCALKQALRTGEPVRNRAIQIARRDGTKVPISVSADSLVGTDGEVLGCVESFRDLSLVQELRRELHGKTSFRDIISGDRQMQALFALLPEAALSGAPILITGPSGSGKELFARAIHDLGAERRGPFVPVNCDGVPEEMLLAEVFGSLTGMQGGATRPRAGRVTAAAGGTLFLDELGALSPALQIRLLRLLEESTYEPVGSDLTVPAEVRILAASSCDLEALRDAGKLRPDLYYRLNGIRLNIPALKERQDDVPLLTEHFIARLSRLRGKEIEGVTDGALALLMAHPWPGNVRELLHALEYAFLVCPGGMIRQSHLPASVYEGGRNGGKRPRSLDDAEAVFLREVLARNLGSRAATARELGIHKTTLWRKMKRLGID
jgi:PAS domain S-box-containing protein